MLNLEGLIIRNGNETVNVIILTIIAVVFICACAIIITFIHNHRKKHLNHYYYQEELFNALGSNIDDIFIIYDVLQKKFEYVSPNFEKNIGISSDTLMNHYMDLMQYMSDDSRKKILLMLSAQQMKTMTEVEFEYIHPLNGALHNILLRVYPVYQKSGQLFRYVSCITDTTKEKAAQKALEEAMEKLKEANEAKKSFLSHISHELKTPLNAIIGMTQIAANSIDDTEKTIHCLKRINYASGKLVEMINNILDISKIDSAKLILESKAFSIRELIEQVNQIIVIQTELQHQEFHSKTDTVHDYILIGDEMRVLQIINNCFSNATKFTPAGGTISFEVIETEKSEDAVALQFIISDTGKGMSHDYLDHIFVPFEQEDLNIAKKYGGTGLGMSITYSLVTLMGGSIHIDSTPEVGTCITIDITFPISKEFDYKAPLQKDIRIISDYNFSGKHALVVEDNEINQEIICEFLKYIKLDVIMVSDGNEALKQFEASDPGYFDIILMDLVMPGMDGYETTSAIRKSSHPDALKVCIIAMTADNFAEHDKSLACGMNYHITKPFEVDSFFEIIHKVMETDM